MKLTQHKIITEYVREHGSITPAKLNDSLRAYRGEWIGSQADKRCRELREKGILISHKEGKYEVFTLKPPEIKIEVSPFKFRLDNKQNNLSL